MPPDVPYRTSKKALDRLVAGGLAVALSPLVAVVLGAMGIDMLLSRRDRGPLLYRERRISHGREFELLKLRTVRRDVLAAAARGDAHARLLEREPDNLTWAGRRILKPWYLDELPQLWNVLRGEMSLVGPRPWPVHMVRDQVARGLDYRNRIVAGWTGPAQVEKGVTEPAGYATLDLAYVEASLTWPSGRLLRHDLGILRRTVVVLAKGEGLRF